MVSSVTSEYFGKDTDFLTSLLDILSQWFWSRTQESVFFKSATRHSFDD